MKVESWEGREWKGWSGESIGWSKVEEMVNTISGRQIRMNLSLLRK